MLRIGNLAHAVTAWRTSLTRRQLATLFALVAITVVGASLRAWPILDRPLWEDEAYTWQDCQTSWPRLLWWKHDPAHGPLSHILVRLSIDSFGTDAVWALRLPALVCGILCIPAAFWLGRTVAGDALGLLTATLVAIDPNMVDQSQQARMYTMLALASMLVIAQAIRLLADPPARRGPWVLLAVLLSLQFWVNFGALALWIGLSAAVTGLALIDLRAGGEAAARARLRMRGMATTYAWAVLFSARGLWRMYIFARSDRGITTTTAADTLRATWQAFEQLTGAGPWTALVPLAIALGLFLVRRRSRAAATILSATALVGLAMILAGRSVHHMIAARYFTIIQPTMWIALAALPILATVRVQRLALASGLALLIGVETWQATHVDRWIDLNTWRYARSASRFIEHERGSNDLFAAAPAINFGVVARYYDLIGPGDVELRKHMTDQTSLPSQLGGRTTWMQGYMFDPRATNELRAMLQVSRAGERLGIDPERLIATVKDQGLVVVRLSDDRFEAWVYDAPRDDFRPLSTIVAAGKVKVRAATNPSRSPQQ